MEKEIQKNILDHSISALRTLRLPDDDDIFWYRDDMHLPYPVTPLFLKISRIVTDTGGMLSHTAIVSEEYGAPAVVGTWNATRSIRDGDIVRIDGDKGSVQVIQRAVA